MHVAVAGPGPERRCGHTPNFEDLRRKQPASPRPRTVQWWTVVRGTGVTLMTDVTSAQGLRSPCRLRATPAVWTDGVRDPVDPSHDASCRRTKSLDEEAQHQVAVRDGMAQRKSCISPQIDLSSCGRSRGTGSTLIASGHRHGGAR
jgi:hypothetical protein